MSADTIRVWQGLAQEVMSEYNSFESVLSRVKIGANDRVLLGVKNGTNDPFVLKMAPDILSFLPKSKDSTSKQEFRKLVASTARKLVNTHPEVLDYQRPFEDRYMEAIGKKDIEGLRDRTLKTASPLLIIGDNDDKLDLMLSMAKSLVGLHNPKNIQFGIITKDPQRWTDLPKPSYNPDKPSHNIGIFPVNERVTFDFLLSLNTWAHTNRSDQKVFLFLDDLPNLLNGEMEMVDNFRQTLLRATPRGVYPIISVDSDSALYLKNEWFTYFPAVIFGKTENKQLATGLGLRRKLNIETVDVSRLSESQFVLKSVTREVVFTKPTI